jgi:glycolate oxidase FAD binding subunit
MAHGAGGAATLMTTAVTASAEAIRDRLRDASSRGAALRIAGAGTWLDAGRPTRSDETIATRELSGITSYVPGDLTLTARAGTTLGELREATAAHNQWLALDPFGSDEGTLGATIATGSAGPLAAAFGLPRDLVLGVEFVTGDARIVRGGGRVVKNVAGFDLTRLIIGSWGTLGIVTEATVRLHARPAVDQSIAIALGDDSASLEGLRALLRRLPFTPFACEVVDAALARRLVGQSGRAALVRLGGNAEAVHGQRAAFAACGDAVAIDDDVWQRLRACEPPGAFVFRLSRRPSELPALWSEAESALRDCDGARMHANAVRGVVRCIAPATTANATALAEFFRRRGSAPTSSCIGERLADSLWALLPPALTRSTVAPRVKAAFDQSDILNSGILGGAA